MRTFGTLHVGGFVPGDALVPRALRGYLQIRAFGTENTCASQARTITKNLQPHNANLRGVADKKFFLFRIANLYGYPH
jgi:hypothetical protein